MKFSVLSMTQSEKLLSCGCTLDRDKDSFKINSSCYQVSKAIKDLHNYFQELLGEHSFKKLAFDGAMYNVRARLQCRSATRSHLMRFATDEAEADHYLGRYLRATFSFTEVHFKNIQILQTYAQSKLFESATATLSHTGWCPVKTCSRDAPRIITAQSNSEPYLGCNPNIN